ncbi:MAG: aldo/keto reductase [Asgard group archaeon]|nr:aldo/keto reductase [Asgard group archaeon]
MKKVGLGKSSLKVSRIGLGSLAFGHKAKGIQDKEQILDVLNYAFDSGINLINTAEEYAGGLSEKYIGEVIKNRGDREDIIICTKVSPNHLGYRDVIRACNYSLERLQTDYIDLYNLHWSWCYDPLSETMKAMDELLADGKIRYVGVSNFHNVLLQEANDHLQNGEIIVNEIEYNLVNRHIEKELLPFLKSNNISILAYCPLLHGLLSTNYDENTVFPESDFRYYNPLFANKENFSKLKKLFDLMRTIAKNHDVKPVEVALNWLLQDDLIVPIPGAKKRSHIDCNVHAAEWKMTKDEFDNLTKASANIYLDIFRH